ncbi:MAG: hypothetical protein WCE21_01790 [Candidatus Babeliales bacterium]
MRCRIYFFVSAFLYIYITVSIQSAQVVTQSVGVAKAAQSVLQSAPSSVFGNFLTSGVFNTFSFNALSQGLDSAIKDSATTAVKGISSGVHDMFYSLVTAIRPATELPGALSSTIEKAVAESATKSILSNPLVSFGVQAILMAGIGFATSRMDEQDQRELKEYGQKQVDASRAYDEFQKKMQVDQGKGLRQLGDAFVAAKKKIDDSFVLSGKRLQAEIAYLNRAINLDKPVQQCLESWVQWDLFFETSRMRVPSSTVWHNIFNIFTSDDWSYDSTQNTFCQNSVTQWPQPVFWDLAVDKRNLLTQDPSVHHIFTEYATQGGQYDIEIDCTLIATQYPFFAGIVFNRGRWISGDPERLWWYRLLGVYGAPGAPASMMLDGAQLRMVSDTEGKRNLVSPLEQIVKNNGLIKKKLDPSLVNIIKTDPITFVFRITNKPNTCDINVQYHTGDATKTTALYNGTISSLDDYLYRFHGIGFMAIGCQASFVIKKPEALVYSQAEREAFKKRK